MRFFRKGDRVVLSRIATYKSSKSNPTQGTKYECEGIITNIHTINPSIGPPISPPISVNWDNTYENIYNHQDLLLIDDINLKNCNYIW